jgi:alkyldihydroxyacetonephosphate synthase
MRRWNGWGDDRTHYDLPAAGARFIAERVGPGGHRLDASLDDVVGAVPPSRLPEHPLVARDATTRVRHARGQSLPDWAELRYGCVPTFPDGVAAPESEADVRELLRLAAAWGAAVIPYGGGTSVVGHITPLAGRPTLTVSLARMGRLLALDEASRLATFEAGVSGPDLEAQLRARGFTLGHFPQSFEYSTLGGWVATRSSGQQSLRYGRVEQLFAGGRVETPAGPVDLPPLPASAAGPDLRQLVLGSEGRAGIITRATVRVTPLPAREESHAIFFAGWAGAVEAARALAQSGLPLAMLRLSTPVETTTNLAIAGHERAIAAIEALLAARGLRAGKCMLLLGLAGDAGRVAATRREALAVAARHGGVSLGQTLGRQWTKNRFRTPYLRNSLWERGYAVDTVETALEWRRVPALVDALDAALPRALAPWGERCHVFTHLSHVYPSGSSVYTTVVFRLAPTLDELLARWRALKAAASETILAYGGTISHQHGVGADHAAYLRAEKGELGIAAIGAALRQLDPDGIMNPGKLLDPAGKG